MAVELPDAPLVDERRGVSMPWAGVFTLWATTISALRQSGTTANRPTAGLWVGRMYFDTTLGVPIWVHSVGPAVWVDAFGATV